MTETRIGGMSTYACDCGYSITHRIANLQTFCPSCVMKAQRYIGLGTIVTICLRFIGITEKRVNYVRKRLRFKTTCNCGFYRSKLNRIRILRPSAAWASFRTRFTPQKINGPAKAPGCPAAKAP
jgi:hypothetical protein